MKINTESNTYTIVYASITVVLIAFLLAFVYQIMQPMSEANEQLDKKKQILAALNIRNVKKAEIESVYNKTILCDPVYTQTGEKIASGKNKDQDGFIIALKDITKSKLPIYVCRIGKEIKYVIPLSGKGLWGAIWGYLALDKDCKTIFGVYFAHQSETAGLGARITESEFQKEFVNKRIFLDDNYEKIGIHVVKSGTVKNPQFECDGISGATLTSDGLNDMIHDYLGLYKNLLKKINSQDLKN